MQLRFCSVSHHSRGKSVVLLSLTIKNSIKCYTYSKYISALKKSNNVKQAPICKRESYSFVIFSIKKKNTNFYLRLDTIATTFRLKCRNTVNGF